MRFRFCDNEEAISKIGIVEPVDRTKTKPADEVIQRALLTVEPAPGHCRCHCGNDDGRKNPIASRLRFKPVKRLIISASVSAIKRLAGTPTQRYISVFLTLFQKIWSWYS